MYLCVTQKTSQSKKVTESKGPKEEEHKKELRDRG